MVVAQLVERSLPSPEIRDSKPVIGKILCIKLSTNCIIEKTKIKKTRLGMAHLKKPGWTALHLGWRLNCFVGGTIVWCKALRDDGMHLGWVLCDPYLQRCEVEGSSIKKFAWVDKRKPCTKKESINHYYFIAARIDKMNKVFITQHYEVRKISFMSF